MNIREYISSGIIESYVLGLASADDSIVFEDLCRQHPELMTARIVFEIALEDKLLHQATAPAVAVKEMLMEAIRTDASPTM